MSEPLTTAQKDYIALLFEKYERNMNQKYEDTIKPELDLLARYKHQLAKDYDSMGGYRQTLIGVMQDILNIQENLQGLMTDLTKLLQDRLYQGGKDMDTIIAGVERIAADTKIQDVSFSDNKTIDRRIKNCLFAENLKIVGDLVGRRKEFFLRIPNMGKKYAYILHDWLKANDLPLTDGW